MGLGTRHAARKARLMPLFGARAELFQWALTHFATSAELKARRAALRARLASCLGRAPSKKLGVRVRGRGARPFSGREPLPTVGADAGAAVARGAELQPVDLGDLG